MRILGLSGSLRDDSYNTGLLRAAAELAAPGAEVTIYDGLRDIPAYDQDAEADAPASVEALRQAIREADAVLIATPEYNGSVPGFLKNALDWVSRPRATTAMANKPAAVVGASPGAFGAVWAQADLRRILGLVGARVLDRELAVGRARDRFSAEGELVDDEIREQLGEIVESLVDSAREREALAA